MSSTKSPISSGQTNGGTHNSSTAQRSWRRSLYFRMIPAWRVGEIEFQCRLARFVISKRLEFRLASGESKWSLKGKYDEFGRKRGAPPGKEESLMWSSRWARGVLLVIEERRMKLRGKNPCQGAPKGIEERISSSAAHPCSAALKGERGNESRMKQRRSYSRSRRGLSSTHPRGGAPRDMAVWSAEWNIDAPFKTEERRRGLRSTHYGGGAPLGGVWSSPTMCNCDECNGICSNSIYHRGRAKFTLIFILRKHNCNLLSSGILRQRTMNCCSHKR